MYLLLVNTFVSNVKNTKMPKRLQMGMDTKHYKPYIPFVNNFVFLLFILKVLRLSGGLLFSLSVKEWNCSSLHTVLSSHCQWGKHAHSSWSFQKSIKKNCVVSNREILWDTRTTVIGAMTGESHLLTSPLNSGWLYTW